MEVQKDFKELLELFNAHNSLFRITGYQEGLKLLKYLFP